MKTPREIILERHRSADAKLDRIRPEILAAYAQAAASAQSDSPGAPGWIRPTVSRVWQEALWPWRRAWIGLAALWLVLGALDLTTEAPPAQAALNRGVPDPNVLAAVRDQRRLMMEWLGPIDRATDPPPSRPGPRSEPRQKPSTA